MATSEIFVTVIIGFSVLLVILISGLCFAYFIRCIINRGYERDHKRRTLPTTTEEEKQNAIATNENGEVHIFGRGSNRSNNTPYEYYVVMRPVNGDQKQEKTIAKLQQKPNFDPYNRPKGPLENWFMEGPKNDNQRRNEVHNNYAGRPRDRNTVVNSFITGDFEHNHLSSRYEHVAQLQYLFSLIL